MTQQAIAAAPEAQSPAASTLPAIGTFIHGGYFTGVIVIDGKQFGLAMAGAAGELSGRWNGSNSRIEGAVSLRDGRENTIDMAAAGSKLAERALTLSIEGYTDWYIPSRDELELAYRHFKPSNTPNYTGNGSGANANSLPTGDKYTRTSPAQTTVAVLTEDEPDALVPGWYWSSTQHASLPHDAWGQYFVDGGQDSSRKSYAGRARAVRRFVI